MKQGQFQSRTLDGAAAALSSLCLLHCLLLPLGFALLPVLGAGLDETSWFGAAWLHWLLIAVAVPVSAYALVQGFRLHGRMRPGLLAIGGFALMLAGALAHGAGAIEPLLTIAGGLLVAFAHWRNWVARRG